MTRQYETTVQLAAAPDLVWAALTEATHMANWFAPEAEVDLKVGGKLSWSWPGLHDWPQTIQVIEPGKRLVTSYDGPVSGEDGKPVPLIVEWTLQSSDGSNTSLRLVQSGFGEGEEFDGEYDGISKGWPIELTSLTEYVERHFGQARQFVSSRRTIEEEHPAAWAKLTGEGGLGCGAQIDQAAPGSRHTFAGLELETTATDTRVYSGRVLTGGGGWVRFTVENCGGPSMAWITLALYGQDEGRVRAEQDRLDALMDRLFASDSAPA